MDITQDMIAVIIGTKEIELVALRVEVAQLKAKLATYEKEPADAVVDGHSAS